MARRQQRPLKDFTDITGMRADLYCRVSSDPRTGEQSVDEKSVDDQEREGKAWAERAGVQLGEVFREDAGRSASRFATRDRPEFQRLLDHVKAGETDIVWVWAVDRSQRDLRVFAELRDVFTQHQVALSVNGKIYDPNDYDGWMLLGITSFFGERFSEELSKNVRRGKRSKAEDGQPPNRTPFGYRRQKTQTPPDPELVPPARVWTDRKSKLFTWQEPNTWDGDDRPIEDSPAWVVREIFRRIASGDSMTSVAKDLHSRGIPTPGAEGNYGSKLGWHHSKLRMIVRNPIYAGRQIYQGGILEGVEPRWPALVDEQTWRAANRVLDEQARRVKERIATRPNAAKSLLAHLVSCAKCGGPISARPDKLNRDRRYYACAKGGCAAIRQDVLDEYVEEVMIRYLSQQELFSQISKMDDSPTAAQAREDAAQARAELEQLYADVKAGTIKARIAQLDEDRLLAQIEEAEKRAKESHVPPALRGRVGPQAEKAWKLATNEIRRKMIAAVAEIQLKPAGQKNRWHPVPVDQRVEWRWLRGPDAG
jgi:site-specific DNA recombinase